MLFALFCKFRSSICESYICYKCCRERLWRSEKSVISMSSGSKGKPSETGFIMGSEFEKQDSSIISIFLEFLGFDDLIGFKSSLEEECHYINEGSLWYGRRIGSKMMGFKEKMMGFCTSFCCCHGLCHFKWGYLALAWSFLHFILSCCTLLIMYSTPCSFYSCCFFSL